jgi:uncharacterized membrane protein YuzA (DUF378 family)
MVGIFGINVVGTLFGEATAVSRVIYSIIALAGLYEIATFTIGYDDLHHRWCETPATVKH